MPRAKTMSGTAPTEPTAARAWTSIEDDEFTRFRDLIEERSGIHLTEVKRSLLVARLARRVQDLGLSSFGAYLDYILDENPGELRQMLDRICTNETSFFRQPEQFDLLQSRFVPYWTKQVQEGRREPCLRIWSAACSTGEEPFSLAMCLRALLPASWKIEILASDLSGRALDVVRRAVWSRKVTASVPDAYRRKYMLRGTGSFEGLVSVRREIRDLVQIEHRNLLEIPPQDGRPFDAIFCRNVMIYFSPATRQRVIRGLVDLLAHDGALFLGHAESLAGRPVSGLVSVAPTVFARSHIPFAPPPATGPCEASGGAA